MVKICPDCGSENADIAQFCKGCGKVLKTEEKKESVSPAPGVNKDLNYNLIGYGLFILTFFLFFVAFDAFNILVSLIYFFISIAFLVFVIYTGKRNLISNVHMFILLILSLFAVFFSFISLFIG